MGISTTDQGLASWSANFHTVALAGPATIYGLTTGELTAFNDLLVAYQAKLAACDPGVRNKAAVAGKRSAKKDLLDNARLLSSIVQGQATVTDEQKIELGVTVRAMPTPIPPPAFAPQVDIISISGHTVTVRLHNSETAGTRRKPAGCKGAAVFSYVGPTAPTDPKLFDFQGNTTLTRVEVAFPTVAAGTTVWITASWFNEKAEAGPAALPVQAIIQYGMGAIAG